MKPLEKFLFTLAGGLLAFNVACSSAPTPTPPPRPTPTSAIQLQRPSVQPITTPTPKQVPATPIPPPTAIPRPAKPIALYGESRVSGMGLFASQYDASVTKITSSAWETGLKVDVIRTPRELRENIQKYSGIWINPADPMEDSLLYLLSQYARNGGRVFFEVGDGWCSSYQLVRSLQNYFNISLACEGVFEGVYKFGELIPLLNDLTVGFDKAVSYKQYYLSAFFVTRDNYVTGKVISKENQTPRAVTAYGEFGQGEIIFMIVYNGYSGRGESMFLDSYVDLYQNIDGSLRIMQWLADSIDMKPD